MVLKIEECKLIESCYTNNGYTWSALTLIEASKDCEVFDLPLAGIPLDVLYFIIKNTDDFIYHAKRVEKTNLDYPVILSDKGVIADGWHRVVKAILEGRETIKAKRLEKMPDADSYIKPEN